MKRRITDLLKKIFSGRKNKSTKITETKPEVKQSKFQSERKAPRSRWIISHNNIQAKNANALKKRRKKNKVARASRKINRAA